MSSTILANVAVHSHGVEFDPSNKKHRMAYAHFLTMNRWPEGVRFKQEWPNTSVVTTVERKLIQHILRSELKAKELEAANLKSAA